MEKRLKELLLIALRYHVTDIHFTMHDKTKNELVIEMRVGNEIKRLKKSFVDDKLINYLMYKADLDISRVFEPQTGSFDISIGAQTINLRFATIVNHAMFNGVLRILNNHLNITISDLSDDEDVVDWMKHIITLKEGLVVFAGPTGSGKTTTLYTLLSACENKKIFTLEDPIEVYNDSFVQLQINEKSNFTYAAGIKQLMRHDPDIVMVGEIRDDIAAKMAVRCALTGHLVLTSIHSANCLSTIERFVDLGVPKHQLKEVLKGISSQRLLKNKDGERKSIYEFMDEKELEYYFHENKHQSEFIDIQKRYSFACNRGWEA